MKKYSLLALVLALPLSVQGFGQRPSPQASEQKKDDDKVVRLGVTLVQVDAVVTDKKGLQITDLRPEDFEIFEDGRPQKITNFSYVTTEPPSAPAAETIAPSGRNAAPVPPVRLRPDQVRRTIALVVDDLSLSFESAYYTQEALKKFVNEQMQPGDMVAILRTGAGMGALQQFTADKRELYAAIERVRWNPRVGRISAFAPISSNPLNPRENEEEEDPLNERRSPDEAIDEFRESLFSVGTLGALNFVVRGLRDLPGRKSVILFSEGFRLYTRQGDNFRFLEALRRLVDLANRASVVIYTVDTRGLVVTGLTAADNVSGLSSGEIETLLRNRSTSLFETQAGLNYLAQETGGFSIRNSNDISGGVARVLDDQKGYYLIGYIPDDSTFRADSGRRAFHKITLKVRRPGLRVRSRKGFYGITDEETRTATGRTARELLLGALLSPFASGDVRLRLTSLFGHDERQGSFVRSLLHVDVRDLSFTQEPDGTRKTAFDVVAFTFGDNGVPLDRRSQSFTMGVRGDKFQEVLESGIVFNLTVPIKKPGAYQLRAAVLDAASERVGSANQYIEVPNVKKNRLVLSGIVLSGGDLDPAVDAPSGEAVAAEASAAAQTSPALRRFPPGSSIRYDLLILNAKPDKKTKEPQLEAQVFVLRDGRVLYTGKRSALKFAASPGKKPLPVAGSLTLGANIEPGEYILQVVVTDKLAKEKYRTTTQWIDFQIVK
ncbi:MAG: VWA domain-containing protein [Blastocatellia bacterium]|nr:VWA domain-containing protein [Blastocatellia bacterium]